MKGSLVLFRGFSCSFALRCHRRFVVRRFCSNMLTVGLESKTEEVWGWVMDESVGMIGIHGDGGVGKTTLLKQIYNKLTSFPRFSDHVIWVTVSQTQRLSLEKVQDDIWKRIRVFNAEWVYKSSKDKAKAIHEALSQKKVVLLLDDLGKPLDLRKVGLVEPEEEDESNQNDFFPSPGNNCKLLFTTRSLEVCRKMGAQVTIKIESLEWEHAWQLFKYMVGEDKLCDPKFLELAQLIARTCKGLPMLLRTVGRAMASKKTYEEWQDSIKGLNFEVAAEHGKVFVPFLLKLCFQSLDQRTRCCLLNFSIFPEDFTILKNELIDFWICKQLIGHGDSEEHGDVISLGYKTIDALVGACLLEEDEINSVRLLDMIRDFALDTDNKFGIPLRNLLNKNMEVGWALTMRYSVQNLMVGSERFLAFVLNHNPFVMLKAAGYKRSSIAPQTSLDQGLSQHGKFLITVLDLSRCGVEEIPRDIADLVSLEYLNLSHTWIESLPVEIKKLVKLKCLNLEYIELLRVVPKQLISSLHNLKVLKLFRCGFLVEEMEDNMLSARFVDIEPICCLQRLEVPSLTITCPSALQKLFSNHRLLNITQSLALEVFWGVKSLDISSVATMKNLVKLEIHQIESLKELNAFSHFIEFERGKSFKNLREITLEKCSSLTELTWVVLVLNLKIFKVKDCDEIEEIVNTKHLEEIFNGQDLEPFSKLEVVVLESLPKLDSIYRKALPFPQLKKMEVTDCYMLKKLPLNSKSAKANKVIIETEEDWWDDIQWEDDGAKGIFVPCFKPVHDEF